MPVGGRARTWDVLVWLAAATTSMFVYVFFGALDGPERPTGLVRVLIPSADTMVVVLAGDDPRDTRPVGARPKPHSSSARPHIGSREPAHPGGRGAARPGPGKLSKRELPAASRPNDPAPLLEPATPAEPVPPPAEGARPGDEQPPAADVDDGGGSRRRSPRRPAVPSGPAKVASPWRGRPAEPAQPAEPADPTFPGAAPAEPAEPARPAEPAAPSSRKESGRSQRSRPDEGA